MKFPTRPDEAARQLLPSVFLKPQADYVVCIVGGRHELWPKNASELYKAEPTGLQQLDQDMLAQWPENARRLIESAQSDSFFIVNMYTIIPAELDAPTNVMLLGDAAHAMTPTWEEEPTRCCQH